MSIEFFKRMTLKELEARSKLTNRRKEYLVGYLYGKTLLKKLNSSSMLQKKRTKMTSLPTVYYGTQSCQATLKDGRPCRNKAYYLYQNALRCGVHSKDPERKELPKDPNKKENRQKAIKEHAASVERAAEKNREEKKEGTVICSQMRMMKECETQPGFLKVYPNYRHQNKEDGFGCSSLSPMSIGPIDSKQPGLPIAKNLENFHQGNKVFPSEVDAKGNVKDSFFTTQKNMYLDPVPHRHKEGASGNVPLFSLWVRQNGEKVRMTYFESRQFYCTFYERGVEKLPDFLKLKDMRSKGYNLQICGYDAYQPTKSIEECYKDTSRPFGHEIVLYTMLVYPQSEWPWRKYRTEEF